MATSSFSSSSCFSSSVQLLPYRASFHYLHQSCLVPAPAKKPACRMRFSLASGHRSREDSKDWKYELIKVASSVLTVFTVATAPAFVQVDIVNALEGQATVSLFQRSCVGCHLGGGNLIQPGATLTGEDLQRNGLTSVESINNIVYAGKGRMPGFGEKCVPRGQCTFGPRLSDEEIQALAEYVRSQADLGWPQVKSN